MSRVASYDGMPQWRALVGDDAGTDPFVLRRFENEKGEAVSDWEIEKGCPVIAIIGSHRVNAGACTTSVNAYLFDCARMVYRLQRLITRAGAGFAFEITYEIRHHRGQAQCVLRIGYGKPVGYRSKRKPLDWVVQEHGDIETTTPYIANDEEAENNPFVFIKKLFG